MIYKIFKKDKTNDILDHIVQIYIFNKHDNLIDIINIYKVNKPIAFYHIFNIRNKNVLKYLLDEHLFTISEKNKHYYILTPTNKLLLEII